MQLSFFLLISHINKAPIRICSIFARNKWGLASIGCNGRSPCKRGLTSSASRGQGPLVYKKKICAGKQKNDFIKDDISIVDLLNYLAMFILHFYKIFGCQTKCKYHVIHIFRTERVSFSEFIYVAKNAAQKI